MTQDYKKALEVCQRWLENIEQQKKNTIALQKAARLAIQGKRHEAMEIKRNIDSQPRVFDGANFEQVMPDILSALEQAQNGQEVDVEKQLSVDKNFLGAFVNMRIKEVSVKEWEQIHKKPYTQSGDPTIGEYGVSFRWNYHSTTNLIPIGSISKKDAENFVKKLEQGYLTPKAKPEATEVNFPSLDGVKAEAEQEQDCLREATEGMPDVIWLTKGYTTYLDPDIFGRIDEPLTKYVREDLTQPEKDK